MKARIIIISAALFLTQATCPVVSAAGSDPKPQSVNAAKPVTGFDFVRAHRQGKGVTVTWAFSTEGAAGFTLQRTYEDPTDPYAVWEDVHSVGNNASRSYKYTDASVFSGSIHYRVVAQLVDGRSTTSGTVSVKIVSKG
jgi:hypothetical protein